MGGLRAEIVDKSTNGDFELGGHLSHDEDENEDHDDGSQLKCHYDDGDDDLEKCLRPWQVFVACYVVGFPRGRGFSEEGVATGTSPGC